MNKGEGTLPRIAKLLSRVYEYVTKKGAKFTAAPIFVCHETAEEAMEADKTGTSCIEVAAPIAERIGRQKRYNVILSLVVKWQR